MASTSNQETFRADGLAGRMVYDVLRQVGAGGGGVGGMERTACYTVCLVAESGGSAS
jgi:hypothetical protein